MTTEPRSRTWCRPRQGRDCARIIGVLLTATIEHAFSPGAHWISCSSAKCYFSQGPVCLQVFPARVTVHSELDSPVRMVRGCRHHCGDRRQHTLAYAGQQVLLMCEIAHVVQKRSSDICLVWNDTFLHSQPCRRAVFRFSWSNLQPFLCWLRKSALFSSCYYFRVSSSISASGFWFLKKRDPVKSWLFY